MQESAVLKVRKKRTMAENVIRINPNEGLALDLMQIRYPVKLFFSQQEADSFSEGVGGMDGVIEMPNEVPMGTLEITPNLHLKNLNQIMKVKLIRNEDSLLISEA